MFNKVIGQIGDRCRAFSGTSSVTALGPNISLWISVHLAVQTLLLQFFPTIRGWYERLKDRPAFDQCFSLPLT